MIILGMTTDAKKEKTQKTKMLKNLIIAFFIFLIASSADAREFPAEVISVYDGDTAHVILDLGLGVYKKDSIRLNGIDTPEIRGKTEHEKELAVKAKEFFIKETENKIIVVDFIEREKYGRLLCNIYYSDDWHAEKPHIKNIKDELIKAGLGRAYDGGKREAWDAD